MVPPTERRVAHVISTPTGVGGAERVLAAIVDGTRSAGWAATILNPFASRDDLTLLRDLVGPTIDVRGRRPASLAAIPTVEWWLLSQLRSLRPAIVHAHLFHAEVLVAALPRRFVPAKRIITHHHGDILARENRVIDDRVERVALRRYDRVIAVSESVERFLAEHHGLRQPRLHRIDNGWSGHPIHRDRSPRAPTVIAIGNLRPEKGHDVLLRAIAVVQRSIPGVRLLLVGDGERRAALEGLAAELGVTSGVEFLGYFDDVFPLLARADVFAFPSRSEPFGIVALEAMAAGLPIVASDVGGIPEIVRPGVNGLLVPPQDVDALAAALVDVLTDPDAAELGRRGKALAEGRRMERTVRSYGTLYEELVPATG